MSGFIQYYFIFWLGSLVIEGLIGFSYTGFFWVNKLTRWDRTTCRKSFRIPPAKSTDLASASLSSRESYSWQQARATAVTLANKLRVEPHKTRPKAPKISNFNLSTTKTRITDRPNTYKALRSAAFTYTRCQPNGRINQPDNYSTSFMINWWLPTMIFYRPDPEPSWRPEELGFFYPNLLNNDVLIIHGNIYYRDIFTFIDRIRHFLRTRSERILKENLHTCLYGIALDWYTKGTTALEKKGLSILSL